MPTIQTYHCNKKQIHTYLPEAHAGGQTGVAHEVSDAHVLFYHRARVGTGGGVVAAVAGQLLALRLSGV